MEAPGPAPHDPIVPDYRRLFEAAPGMVTVVDADLRIVAVTDSLLAGTRRQREELVGRDLFDAFPDDAQREPGQTSSAMRRTLDRVLRERAPDSLAVQRRDLRRPESAGGGFEERYWSTAFVPVLDEAGDRVRYIVIRTTDITDYVRRSGSEQAEHELDVRRRFEEMEIDMLERSRELQAARDRLAVVSQERERLVDELQQLIDLTPDAMVTVNAAGLVIRVNERALELLGYERHELVGRSVEQLLPEALHELHRAHRARYLHAPHARPMGGGLSLVARRRDGTTIPVEVSLSPLQVDHELLVTASVRDISEARAREQALLEQVDRREHAAQRHSAEYQRALRDYRQLIRHRIANPIQVISGAATTMVDHPDLDLHTRRTMLEAIMHAAGSLQRATLFDPVHESAVERELDPTPRAGDAPPPPDVTARDDR